VVEIKAYLRKVKARTKESLWQAIGAALKTVTASDALGWFESCATLERECSIVLQFGRVGRKSYKESTGAPIPEYFSTFGLAGRIIGHWSDNFITCTGQTTTARRCVFSRLIAIKQAKRYYFPAFDMFVKTIMN